MLQQLTGQYTVYYNAYIPKQDIWAWQNGRGKTGADNKVAGKKGAEQKGRRTKRAQSKKGAEQKGREITMLRHHYIQGRNFFR